MNDLVEIIRAARAVKEDMIEAAADSAIAAVKAAGLMSVMPAPHMPTTGLLLFVHPEVYDRIRAKQAQMEASHDAT